MTISIIKGFFYLFYGERLFFVKRTSKMEIYRNFRK